MCNWVFHNKFYSKKFSNLFSSSFSDTALNLAIHRQKYPIVDLLLQYRANPNLSNQAGKTALHRAVSSYNEENATHIRALLEVNLLSINKRSKIFLSRLELIKLLKIEINEYHLMKLLLLIDQVKKTNIY